MERYSCKNGFENPGFRKDFFDFTFSLLRKYCTKYKTIENQVMLRVNYLLLCNKSPQNVVT